MGKDKKHKSRDEEGDHEDPVGDNEDDSRAHRVDDETVGYFRRIGSLLDGGTLEGEDLDNLVQNLYTEMKGTEIKCATDLSCSVTIEKVIRSSTPVQLCRLFSVLLSAAPDLMRHRAASHVLQGLVEVVPYVVDGAGGEYDEADETDDDKDRPSIRMEKLVVRFCKDLKSQWPAILQDNYGTHVLRSLAKVLTGREALDKNAKKKVVNARPPTFKKALKSILKVLVESYGEKMSGLTFHTTAGPTLQVLVDCAGEDGEKLCGIILKLDREDGGKLSEKTRKNLDMMLTDSSGSHMVEAILRNASESLLGDIFNQVYRGRLVDLTEHRFANFGVQQLLLHLKETPHVNMAFDELSTKLGWCLGHARSGIVLRLVQACVRFHTKQKEVCQAISRSLNTHEHPDDKGFLARSVLQSAEDGKQRYGGAAPKCSSMGALIMEALLGFKEDSVKQMVESILALDDETLMGMACHPQGCRVLEIFADGGAASTKRKLRLFAKFDEKYAKLAQDKFGSHAVDKFFRNADLPRKEKIVQELAAAKSSLDSNFHAGHVIRNCRVDEYVRKRGDWVDRETGKARKQDMFKDILEDKPADEEAKKEKSEPDAEMTELLTKVKKSKTGSKEMKALGMTDDRTKRSTNEDSDDDAGELVLERGVQGQEIDDLFHDRHGDDDGEGKKEAKKSKKDKKEKKAKKEKKEVEPEAELEGVVKDRSSKKEDRTTSLILDMISLTKGKKRKKNDTQDGAEKKEKKEKKAKKFMMG